MLLCALAVLALATTACGQPQIPGLPRVRIHEFGISCSGISSGADFAVQFQVAHSKSVMGVGVFAGEPYHCAVTRFPNDEIQTCDQQAPNIRGPGCFPGSAPCEGCPPNTTLIYDHCKVHPEWVDIDQLVSYSIQQSAKGAIDDVHNLNRTRAYFYRGSKDTVYLPGSVRLTEDYYRRFVTSPLQLYFEGSIPSLHAQPTINFGTPCGVGGSPPAMEACNYDGAGVALQHIYSDALSPRGVLNPSNLFPINQTAHFPRVWPGLADVGYIYVPPQCRGEAAQTCNLHIVFHGCGMYAGNKAMNLSFVMHAGYNDWAESNNLIILYPQSGGYPLHNKTGSTQQMSGCWDSYGQQPGEDGTGTPYATLAGIQVETVWSIVSALAGW